MLLSGFSANSHAFAGLSVTPKLTNPLDSLDLPISQWFLIRCTRLSASSLRAVLLSEPLNAPLQYPFQFFVDLWKFSDLAPRFRASRLFVVFPRQVIPKNAKQGAKTKIAIPHR